MDRLFRQFIQREAHPAVQFLKYGIAGGIATGVHVSTFFALSLWVFPAMLPGSGIDSWLADLFGVSIPEIDEALRRRHFILNNTLAFFCSNAVAYVLNFYWVFHPGRHRRYIEMTLFLIVSAVALASGVLLGTLIISVWGASTTTSQFCNIVAAVMINYVCRKYMVFKG